MQGTHWTHSEAPLYRGLPGWMFVESVVCNVLMLNCIILLTAAITLSTRLITGNLVTLEERDQQPCLMPQISSEINIHLHLQFVLLNWGGKHVSTQTKSLSSKVEGACPGVCHKIHGQSSSTFTELAWMGDHISVLSSCLNDIFVFTSSHILNFNLSTTVL